MLIFVTHAAVASSFFARVAELQRAAGLDESRFGLALLGMPAGTLIATFFVSPLIERHGVRTALLVVIPLYGLFPLLGSLATTFASLTVVMLYGGLTLSMCNMTMNVEADRVEAALDRRLINRCHGVWGVGFLAAALIATAAVAAGISPFTHFVLLAAVVCAAAVFVVGPMQASPPRQHTSTAAKRRFALPTVPVLLIFGYALFGSMVEGAVRNWSVIYLRDIFSAADWVATLTLPAFILMMTVTRFRADAWVERYGATRTAMALALVTTAGLALMVTAGNVVVALIGFALMGIGVATTFPATLSAAARLGDRPATENVAALAALQTVFAFLFPPIFGFVAAATTLTVSFALILPFPLIAIYFARYLTEPTAPTGVQPTPSR